MKHALILPFAVLALSLSAQARAFDANMPDLPLDEVAEPVAEVLGEARDRVVRAERDGADEVVRAEAWGHLGDVALAHDLVSVARHAYTNAISLRESRQEWHYLLGLIELGEDRPESAIERFGYALELYPDDYAARVHRGRAHLALGQLDAAARDFGVARDLAPQHAAALAGLGRVALEREEFEQAVSLFNAALERAPGSNRLYYQLGRAFRGLGEVEQARRSMARSGDIEVPVPDPVLGQVQLLSRSAQFYHELALSEADRGRLDAAIPLLERALELEPDNPSFLRDLGDALARQGRMEPARQRFQRWAELAPDDLEPWFYLGQLGEMQGDLGRATEAYEAALEREPADLDARAALARISLFLGDAGSAASSFESLVSEAASPEASARFEYWLGLSRLRQGECAAAADAFEQARSRLDSPDARVLDALARLRSTCLEADTAALDQALAWADRLYRRSPGLSSAETLAMVHAARGEFDDAVDFQAQAMFEAVKLGELEGRPWMQEDMARYRDERKAAAPFADGHPVYQAN
ncbi:MAG: tetratricopeptide repeat protein [Gammaproteobacteria bacterium]|jgi:tetratricopeptide (TPR) repeat protein|nr:tetratricopeptide repeat protein [Gammaproteobacteria bacterium]